MKFEKEDRKDTLLLRRSGIVEISNMIKIDRVLIHFWQLKTQFEK
jgi:hypothetical protein